MTSAPVSTRLRIGRTSLARSPSLTCSDSIPGIIAFFSPLCLPRLRHSRAASGSATPDYDQSFLIAPPEEAEEQDGAPPDEIEGQEDPLYRDAVRVVLEMGKASTSTLQRRLRLGYGRAARILDMMQRDGLIGPPDGSKPREVLKRPDWLDEVEERE
jgi:DNA segregation ATPase FtsK/SpoIIIE-like protein